MAAVAVPINLRHAVLLQYAAGLLIGLGTGGVVGASTLGVAAYSLAAPRGLLREYTAVVPVVNCCANFLTVSAYCRDADVKTCFRMWPWLLVGIALGTLALPLFKEAVLRKTTAIVYALVLAQQLYSKGREVREAAGKVGGEARLLDAAEAAERAKRTFDKDAAFAASLPVAASVSLLCGILTVICNNSGPIFNVYLLSIGLSMDQFVATRAVLMAGKNVAKVGARACAGDLPMATFALGCKIGAACAAGILLARPIKSRTSPQAYKYFTWCVLAYTAVKMWRA